MRLVKTVVIVLLQPSLPRHYQNIKPQHHIETMNGRFSSPTYCAIIEEAAELRGIEKLHFKR